ncbi:MAG: glycosyltransferase family 2 protein [Verrucomicrobiae bacterium]|nr:glycosyltransferase family 2 protein [Verrucomicrobiae bacterium]
MPTPARSPLSVCVVSGAEAHRIGRMLESVADWVAEILVVLDDRAQDDTAAIVERFGGRVFREPWKGFVGQKNSASDRASQPWLLNLDADEVVSPALGRQIRDAITTSPPSSPAFEFPRCTYYCGRWIRHGDWYPDRVTRLWRRGRARWVGEEPHARLEVEGGIGRLSADLLHFSNDRIAGQIAKIAPYHADFVKHRVAAGKSAGLFELAVRPAWRFLRAYFLRRGFLDGWPGFYIAALSAFSTLTRYTMVREAELDRHPAPVP